MYIYIYIHVHTCTHAHIHTHIQAFNFSHTVLHRNWEKPTLTWAKRMVAHHKSLHGHVLRPAIQPSSSLTIQLFVFRACHRTIEPDQPYSHTSYY